MTGWTGTWQTSPLFIRDRLALGHSLTSYNMDRALLHIITTSLGNTGNALIFVLSLF